MKKTIVLLSATCIMFNISTPLQASIFEGLRKLAINLPFLRKPSAPAKETLQTPSDMLPLSEYSCIGKTYTSEDQVNDLAQQLAAGVRYFVFELTESTQSRYLGISKQTTITVGKDKREFSSILDELSKLLHQSQYKNEIILININAPKDQKYLNAILEKNKYLFTPSDIAYLRLRTLLADLRRLNKRMVVLLESTNFIKIGEVPKGWISGGNYSLGRASGKTEDRVGSPLKCIVSFDPEDLPTVNTKNRAAIGSDNFPKTTRGNLLSPHFNMYHYVGIDYTNRPEHNFRRELAYGVRGFILPMSKNQNSYPNISNTEVNLDTALEIISSFAKNYNEIVVVHLRNTSGLLDDIKPVVKQIESLLFKPKDRLTEIQGNTRSENILKHETNDANIIWPRLSWNYQHKKLLQITYDGEIDTENMWSFKRYYNDDFSLKNVDQSFLCYSGMTKARARMTVAATATTAIALSALLIYCTFASIAAFPIAHITRHYPDCAAGIGDACAGIGIIAGPDILLGSLLRLGLGTGGVTMFASLGIFINNNIHDIFTLIEKIKVSDNPQILTTGFFTKDPIQRFIQAKITNQNMITMFDKVNRLNQVDNFITIDKFNMTWYLRLAHSVRKALEDKPEITEQPNVQ